MSATNDLVTHASPGGRPQPLAFHDGTLWVGSWDTSHLYAIDPKTWTVTDSVEAPGQPFGLASHAGALYVVVSANDDDDRTMHRFVPGAGFDGEYAIECPDRTGSHLTSDGSTLFLVQQSYGKLLALDADGSVLREIELPSRCAGAAFASGAFIMISADDEFDELALASLDLDSDEPALTLLAGLSAEARGLAFDGDAFWTCYREQSQIVTFALADSLVA